jgi:hypothetical protein
LKVTDLIRSRTRDLPACSIVSQPTTLYVFNLNAIHCVSGVFCLLQNGTMILGDKRQLRSRRNYPLRCYIYFNLAVSLDLVTVYTELQYTAQFPNNRTLLRTFVQLSTHIHLVPRPRMVEIYLHSPLVFKAWGLFSTVHGQLYLFITASTWVRLCLLHCCVRITEICVYVRPGILRFNFRCGFTCFCSCHSDHSWGSFSLLCYLDAGFAGSVKPTAYLQALSTEIKSMPSFI